MSINDSNSIRRSDNMDIKDKTKSMIDISYKKRNNKRANITAKRYQKEITDRRKKVNNLLMKGYSQQEIMSKLHLSQSTASRDIAFLYKQTKRNSLNIGKVAFEELHKSMSGTTDMLQRAWDLLDAPSNDRKLQLKIMEFIMDCYSKRTQLIQAGPMLIYLGLETKRHLTIDRFLKKNNTSINELTLKAIIDTTKEQREADNWRRIEEAIF
ncbi:MAG: hypothetical protein R2685_15855 [Candidatus Nitrosocosmicus sp.]|nr:hypothetical protein [Candidatus Nitrosocosmicus sp.]